MFPRLPSSLLVQVSSTLQANEGMIVLLGKIPLIFKNVFYLQVRQRELKSFLGAPIKGKPGTMAFIHTASHSPTSPQFPPDHPANSPGFRKSPWPNPYPDPRIPSPLVEICLRVDLFPFLLVNLTSHDKRPKPDQLQCSPKHSVPVIVLFARLSPAQADSIAGW